MPKNVLVVAAHSDDEAIGCSGTIAKHVNSGDNVHLLFMTDGVGSRDEINDLSKERKSAAKNASEILGVTSFMNLDFPDNKMDSIPLLEITQEIEKVIQLTDTEIVYTHHVGDLNIDHQITHKAVMTACRSQPGLSVKEIYGFEVLSSTEWQTPNVMPFCPNVFITISEEIETKIKVLKAYSYEMREPPHTRSIENIIRLNALRGACVGVYYAEAFSLIRSIRN